MFNSVPPYPWDSPGKNTGVGCHFLLQLEWSLNSGDNGSLWEFSESCWPFLGFPSGSVVKNLPVNAEDICLILGLGRSSGEGNGNPLQYSCLENSMDRGAWWATVYRVAKSQTWLSGWTTTTDVWKCINPCIPIFPCNFKVCGLAPVFLQTLGQSVENFLALYMQRFDDMY